MSDVSCAVLMPLAAIDEKVGEFSRGERDKLCCTYSTTRSLILFVVLSEPNNVLIRIFMKNLWST